MAASTSVVVRIMSVSKVGAKLPFRNQRTVVVQFRENGLIGSVWQNCHVLAGGHLAVRWQILPAHVGFTPSQKVMFGIKLKRRTPIFAQ